MTTMQTDTKHPHNIMQPVHVCPPSVAKLLNSPVRTLFENPRRILKGLVAKEQTAVDLGCGGGVFTAELARMVGPYGKVYAVDLQAEMLEITRKFLTRRNLQDRVVFHQCQSQDLVLTDVEADLVIAIYMVHETPDPERFIRQAAGLVKPGGQMFILEPKGHVNAKQLGETKELITREGLKMVRPYRLMAAAGGLFRKQ